MRRTGSRCGRAIAALLFVGALLAAGCGVSTDGHPRAINRDQVRDLLSPNTTAPASSDQGPKPLQLYYVRDQNIQEVCRRGYQDDVRAVLEQLLAGPSDTERKRGLLTTFIPPRTRLLSLDLSASGTLVISLSEEMDDLSGASARNAYAQLVYTATGVAGVRDVSFRSDDHLIEVPTSGRNKKTVSRSDYAPTDTRNGSTASATSCLP